MRVAGLAVGSGRVGRRAKSGASGGGFRVASLRFCRRRVCALLTHLPHTKQQLKKPRHELGGTELARVVIPCAVPRALLGSIVTALYSGQLVLGPDNVEAVYRAADAMQMPALLEGCERYLRV